MPVALWLRRFARRFADDELDVVEVERLNETKSDAVPVGLLNVPKSVAEDPAGFGRDALQVIPSRRDPTDGSMWDLGAVPR